MKLSDLTTGGEGIVVKVRGRGAFRRRIMELGFVKGNIVKVIKNAPLRDPIEYSLLNYRVSLRRSEADLIVVADPASGGFSKSPSEGSRDAVSERRYERVNGNAINVAFVGNPNAGKTSLFNYTSRSNEHTGNYSGVTIDSKSARLEHKGCNFYITDLPGTYSMSAYSPEELFVREFITETIPDVVVNVVDVSNLERNLYLTTQLIDMDIRVVLAFNMFDELEKREDRLDQLLLAQLLGIPIVPTIGTKGKGIPDLLDTVMDVYNDRCSLARHIHIHYGSELELSISRIQELLKIPDNFWITDRVSSRFLAIKLLEQDKHAEKYIRKAGNFNEIMDLASKERSRIEQLHDEDTVSLFTGKRYGFIRGALLETYEKSRKEKAQTTDILDSFLTHKLFGFPFFILFMWLMFAGTFKLGEYPQLWIEEGVAWLHRLIGDNMADGSLKDLLIDGIIGGVGGVIVFLPNILILFLFISFMEDSGYMARAVFIMDKLMHKIGLHGKSFIPLLMGFGCNVPAIMATRSIEDRNNRLLTMLINPFMSCSARLPVYLLLIGAIFPAYQGTLLFSLYFTGILIAIGVALLFRRLFFRTESTPFVMELPPYRLPTARSLVKHMWHKGSQYLKKMGGVILVASVLLWALGYFPRTVSDNEPDLTVTENRVRSTETTPESYVVLSGNGDHLAHSYIGRIGKKIEPVIRPLGFNWKMGVSLISGIAAKEIVVSTLGVLYQVDVDDHEGENRLADKLQDDVYTAGPKEGQHVFSPLSTLSFLIFILVYFPCIAVFAAVKKESGSIWWAVFMIAYTTLLAYILSFVVYQGGSIFLNLT